MKISKHEMIEAFTLRAGYAAGKARQNAGKKFENRWHVVKANAEAVLEWLRGQDAESVTVSPELAPTDEHAPTEEHAPADELAPGDDEDGVREDLIKIFDITDAPGDGQQVTGKLDSADDGAVATDKDVGHKDDQQVKPSDDVWDEIDRMAEYESKVIEEIAAEESAKAADDVCAMIQAAETGEPMPEHDYTVDETTGLEIYRGPLHAGTDALPVLFSDTIRKTYRAMKADRPNEWEWSLHQAWDTPSLEALVATLVVCACNVMSISSNGWQKVCKGIDLGKIFEDGPMNEEIGSITAIRDGEKTKLTLTREMVFDAYYIGSGYSLGRGIEGSRQMLKHVKGLRCIHTFKHADRVPVVPCVECMSTDTCYIGQSKYLECHLLGCRAQVWTSDDPAKRRQILKTRIAKHAFLKDFSSNK